MTEDDNSSTLYGALGTEQFMLQSIASSTISESGTRAGIYLSTLSGGLVAIGFSGSTAGLLAPLAFTVLPTIWLLGCFTIVRLVDTSIANIAVERRIERIRARYATLGNGAESIFAAEDPLTTGKFGVRYSRWSILFTVATMIGVVNAVLGGAVVALALTVGAGLATLTSTCIAVVVALVVLIAIVAYQRKRVGALFTDRPTNTVADSFGYLTGTVDDRIAQLAALDSPRIGDPVWLRRQLTMTLNAMADDETKLDIEAEAREDF